MYFFREALKQIKGIDVFAFTTPESSLEHFTINQEFYRVVISDYRMPNMTGIEGNSRKMKKMNQAVRRILISAFEIQDDLRDCNCVDQFLKKPISTADLINEVEAFVTKPNLEKN